MTQFGYMTDGKQWWKDHEQLGLLFERALRPLETVIHNVRQLDDVGVQRQMDVGIFEPGQTNVRAFVEVQRRASKVGIEDFGGWIYKMQTIGAQELVVLSAAGFAESVLEHVAQKFSKTVRLAQLHEIVDGRIDRLNTQFVGPIKVNNVFGFPGVFYQTVDDEISSIQPLDANARLFFSPEANDHLSIVQLVSQPEIDLGTAQYYNLTLKLPLGGLIFQGKTLKRLMICMQVQRKVDQVSNRFFAYDEVYPTEGRRGICVVSEFELAGSPVSLQVVAVPTERDVMLSGQLSHRVLQSHG